MIDGQLVGWHACCRFILHLFLVSILSVSCCSCPGSSILSDSCIFVTHYIASSHDDTFDHDIKNNESLCWGLWYCIVCGPTKNGLPHFILWQTLIQLLILFWIGFQFLWRKPWKPRFLLSQFQDSIFLHCPTGGPVVCEQKWWKWHYVWAEECFKCQTFILLVGIFGHVPLVLQHLCKNKLLHTHTKICI